VYGPAIGVVASRKKPAANTRHVPTSSASALMRVIQRGGSGNRKREWTKAKNMPTANQSMKLGSHMLTTPNSFTVGIAVRMASQRKAAPNHVPSTHSWRRRLASMSPRCRLPTIHARTGSAR